MNSRPIRSCCQKDATLRFQDHHFTFIVDVQFDPGTGGMCASLSQPLLIPSRGRYPLQPLWEYGLGTACEYLGKRGKLEMQK
jgi:hypothetical protein